MRKINMFCIPHAGGSAAVYYKWQRYLSKNIALKPVELSGRGERMGEPFYKNFEEAVEDIYLNIKNDIKDNDYVLYGHSMGSWLVYELYNKVKKYNMREPLKVIVSAKDAPNNCGKNNIHKMNNDDFKKNLLKLGGTPREILEDENLEKIFVPIIRADYKILENHRFDLENKVQVPLVVFNGSKDKFSMNEILEWKNFTKSQFNLFNFDGGHFFIYEDLKLVCKTLNEVINENI